MIFMFLLALSSCGIFSEIRKQGFIFDNGSVKRKIVMAIPSGFKERLATMDQKGIRKYFFTYTDGAIIYVAVLQQPNESASVSHAKLQLKSSKEYFYKCWF